MATLSESYPVTSLSSHESAGVQQAAVAGRRAAEGEENINVGSEERMVSVAAGAVCLLNALGRRGVGRLLAAGIGAALVHRGVTGRCHGYEALGLDSSESAEPGTRRPAAYVSEIISEKFASQIEVRRSMLINRSPEELYDFWRGLENLPKFMTHLKSVEWTEEGRTHWVAEAPWIVGGTISWDAEIVEDNRPEKISWKSTEDSALDQRGSVRFRTAGDRGTLVEVELHYRPPGGRLTHWISKIFGNAPEQQIADDLKRFKCLMEAGELPTITGQPRGTCVG